jgi:23S rRNA-/tRNA-specific pseudouridylate synthase
LSRRPQRPDRAPTEGVKLTPAEIAFVRGLVIYEDADILALNKPSGLSSQGGRGQVHTLDELLWAFAKPGKARPRLIHRLDRDTSGVILTARTKPAAGFLGKAMMDRKFSKTSRAVRPICASAPRSTRTPRRPAAATRPGPRPPARP